MTALSNTIGGWSSYVAMCDKLMVVEVASGVDSTPLLYRAFCSAEATRPERRKEQGALRRKRAAFLPAASTLCPLFKSHLLDMPERAHVPKFGKWESYGTSPFPYTQYFEKAREDRQGAKVTNPNDPHHNPEAFHADITPNHASPTRNAENDIRRHDGSPLHHNSVTHSSTLGSPRRVRADQMAPGGHRRRQDRANDVFDDNRGKRSPVHPSYQVGFGGAYSPPEGLSADNHPYTSKSAGRLRMAGLQDDKKIKKGSLVPKFGEWDETLPYTADGYSAVFSKVREEKQREMIQAGPVVVPSESNPKAYNNTDHEPSGCWCFRWCKK